MLRPIRGGIAGIASKWTGVLVRLLVARGASMAMVSIYLVHEILVVSLLDERDDSSWAFGGAAVILAFCGAVSWEMIQDEEGMIL